MVHLNKKTLGVLYLVLERESLGLKPTILDITLDFYKDATKEHDFDVYKCNKCGNKIQNKKGFTKLKGRCRIKKKDGKRCGAMRDINWRLDSTRKERIFHDTRIQNTYMSNIKYRYMKKLEKVNLIKINQSRINVNYRTLMINLFSEMQDSLGTWRSKIELLVDWHYDEVLKNQELLSRIFYYPILLLNSQDPKYVPTDFKKYLSILIEFLGLYELKDNLFRNIIEKTFNLSSKEKSQLIMLQRYCSIHENKKKKKFLIVGYNTWGVVNDDPYVPTCFSKSSKILKKMPKKIKNAKA